MYPDESNLKLRLIDGTEYGIQVEFYVKGGVYYIIVYQANTNNKINGIM